MSVAYFIVLDNAEEGVDTFVNGKAIAQAFDEITTFCEAQGLKTIEDFHSQDISEFMQDIDDVEIPGQEILWFDAQEGIDWITSLLEKIESQNPDFTTEAIIEDLREYLEVFKKTKTVGAKWHLELDF